MFIVVYAIAKNEERFAERWMRSMAEADRVVVLDTGSTDRTVPILRAMGAEVTVGEIKPWRFDAARNCALELVPEEADICVCTDLDEVFRPGWREALEKAWAPGTGQARYRYTWSFTPDGKEGVVFWIEKAHARQGYRWTHPVHEVLAYVGEGEPGPMVSVPGMQLDHHPDPGKPRSQYLPLLEQSVREDPEDDRNAHYLGREYFFYGRWDDCIAALIRHLSLPRAVWRDERAASMRYIAGAYARKGEPALARDWYLRAVAEAPWLREPYVDLAFLLYEQEKWDGVLYFTGCALEIENRAESYICEADAWGSLPHDLRCQAFYKTGRAKEALAEAEKALSLSPSDKRLEGNVRLLREMAR